MGAPRKEWHVAAQTIAALGTLTGEWVDCVGSSGLSWIANYINAASDTVVALEVSFDGGTTALTANTVTPGSTSSAGFHVRRTWTNDIGGEAPGTLTDVVFPGVPGPLARLKISGGTGTTAGNFALMAHGHDRPGWVST